MSHYSEVRDLFLKLVDAAKLPIPAVGPHWPHDPCDVTDAFYVRINDVSCGSYDGKCNTAYHARHLFGHWLCDLHSAEACEQPTREGCRGVSDQVADAIADMCERIERTRDT